MKQILIMTTLALVALGGPHPAHGQTAVQAWARRYSAPAESNDQVAKTVVDSSDNVIVAGSANGGTIGSDWLIIKYSGAGVPLWTNRYDGAANSDDVASAMAVDGSGNVFVTGQSGSDNATVGYSGAGVPLWTNHFAGGARAIAADSSGNVFVTGYSSGGASGDDYATIKYSGAGVPLWTNRYNDQWNLDDWATAVTVDGSGNVFVTGASANINFHPYIYDYATIKYSGAGVALWTNRYNGPGNRDDLASALAVDGSGNVFVTGNSYTLYWDGTDYVYNSDYATIAYSGAGVPLWTNLYDWNGNDFATAVAVDASGNVVVTGSSLGSSGTSYATIKYSGAGVTLWANRYDGGLVNSDDSVAALAVDGNGNVFVTGSSYGNDNHYEFGSIKYSGSGLTLWTNRYNGPGNSSAAKAAAIDSSGNVVVAGDLSNNGSSDFATIKYSGAGVSLWTNLYNSVTGGNSSDRAAAVAVDRSGNVFVAGSSIGIGSYDDYATIKYSGAGVALWTNRYNGPGNGSDVVTAMAVDGSGNVFVTGWSSNTVSPYNYDYATVAYSGAGVPLWTNRYNEPGDGNSQPNALAVDAGGNVFVTGTSAATTYPYISDYVTIKYSGAGVPLWTNRYSDGYNIANAIAVDSSGNVLVTGQSTLYGGGSDYATIKYSSAGTALWTNRYDGPGNGYGDDRASALAVDGSGNVFVTGSSLQFWCDDCIYFFDYATIKYSGAGVPLWTNRYSGLGNEVATALAVDGGGNVLVTGNSAYTTYPYISDYVTIKYSGAGLPLWTNRYNGSGNGDDRAVAVAADGNGNVFVTGSSGSTNVPYAYKLDYVTLAYSPAGVPLWTNRYNGPANGDDSPGGKQSLALSPDGSVYVTGRSDGDYTSGTIYDFATVKYAVLLPSLTIARTTTNTVAISWTSPSTGFTLQENTNSIATPNWNNVLSTPTDNGTTKTVIVNPATGNRFFRLKNP